MDLRQAIALLVQASVFLTVAGFGLHATRDDILFLVRRPPLLARSLTAMFAIMPAAAIRRPADRFRFTAMAPWAVAI